MDEKLFIFDQFYLKSLFSVPTKYLNRKTWYSNRTNTGRIL